MPHANNSQFAAMHYRIMHNLTALTDNSMCDGYDARVAEDGSEL